MWCSFWYTNWGIWRTNLWIVAFHFMCLAVPGVSKIEILGIELLKMGSASCVFFKLLCSKNVLMSSFVVGICIEIKILWFVFNAKIWGISSTPFIKQNLEYDTVLIKHYMQFTHEHWNYVIVDFSPFALRTARLRNSVQFFSKLLELKVWHLDIVWGS